MSSDKISLWIDDERNPDDPFWQRECYARPGMVWAKNYDEAIAIIDSGKVEYVSFDHDLGEKKTGADIARYFAQKIVKGVLPKPEWTVHSANPIGSKNIVSIMFSMEKMTT